MNKNTYKKKCTKCKRYKLISEFNRRKLRKSPRYICGECGNKIEILSTTSWCKGCKGKADEKFRKDRPDYHVKYMRVRKKGEENE